MRRSSIAAVLVCAAGALGCQRPPPVPPSSPDRDEFAPVSDDAAEPEGIGDQRADTFDEALERYAEAVRALDDRPHEEAVEDLGRVLLVLADVIEIVPGADTLAPAEVAEEVRRWAITFSAEPPPPEGRAAIAARALGQVNDFLKRAADEPYEPWPIVRARVRELSLAVATITAPRPLPLEREDMIDALREVEDVLRAIDAIELP